MTDQACKEMGAAALARGNKGTPLIEMRDIYKIFRTGAGDFTALNGVNVCFFEGEFVSVVGKSGSGKSTLVNMLTGIDHPTSGTVRVGEHYIHQLSEGRMSKFRGTNLGIIFQFFQLLPMLSIRENIMPNPTTKNYSQKRQKLLETFDKLKIFSDKRKESEKFMSYIGYYGTLWALGLDR